MMGKKYIIKNNMWVLSSFEVKMIYFNDNGYKTITSDQLEVWKNSTLEIGYNEKEKQREQTMIINLLA